MSGPEHRPGCDGVSCTMRAGGEPAAIARARGWGPGTVIEGDEGYGLTRLRIDYLGRRILIATALRDDHVYAEGEEGQWVLWCRCWGEVTQ